MHRKMMARSSPEDRNRDLWMVADAVCVVGARHSPPRPIPQRLGCWQCPVPEGALYPGAGLLGELPTSSPPPMTPGGWGDAAAAPATTPPTQWADPWGPSRATASTGLLSASSVSWAHLLRKLFTLGSLGASWAPQELGSNIHSTESILCGQSPGVSSTCPCVVGSFLFCWPAWPTVTHHSPWDVTCRGFWATSFLVHSLPLLGALGSSGRGLWHWAGQGCSSQVLMPVIDLAMALAPGPAVGDLDPPP